MGIGFAGLVHGMRKAQKEEEQAREAMRVSQLRRKLMEDESGRANWRLGLQTMAEARMGTESNDRLLTAGQDRTIAGYRDVRDQAKLVDAFKTTKLAREHAGVRSDRAGVRSDRAGDQLKELLDQGKFNRGMQTGAATRAQSALSDKLLTTDQARGFAQDRESRDQLTFDKAMDAHELAQQHAVTGEQRKKKMFGYDVAQREAENPWDASPKQKTQHFNAKIAQLLAMAAATGGSGGGKAAQIKFVRALLPDLLRSMKNTAGGSLALQKEDYPFEIIPEDRKRAHRLGRGRQAALNQESTGFVMQLMADPGQDIGRLLKRFPTWSRLNDQYIAPADTQQPKQQLGPKLPPATTDSKPMSAAHTQMVKQSIQASANRYGLTVAEYLDRAPSYKKKYGHLFE